MRILGLDLSKNIGWAFLDSGTLSDKGVIRYLDKVDAFSDEYPFNFITMAETLARQVETLFWMFTPDVIVIEEVNSPKGRYDHKKLEFIHCAVCSMFLKVKTEDDLDFKVKYLSSSEWRHSLSLSLSKDQRSSNNHLKTSKDDARQKITEYFRSTLHSEIQSAIHLKTSKLEIKRIQKQYDSKIQALVKKEMIKNRVKVDGKTLKKVSFKDLSVAFVNRHFGLSLTNKENDIADAICLAYSFHKDRSQSSN